MATSKGTIYLEVNDGGTIKKVAVDAAHLNAELSKAGKSAATADRNLKGTARTSSNSTKNFSKMAQGISGGIVPVYATLAAQVFALGAAYRYLQNVADVRVLAEGQVAMTRATAVGYASITKSIMRATDAQLSYKEAAEAAAIGTAFSLTSDELTGLAKAATKISKILGRDLTDTFSRLIRGVTKAEPELLDELGIVLRLADAAKTYAQARNINPQQLTVLEKQRAVYEEVVRQTERISAALGKLEPATNSINQLGVAFSELGRKSAIAIAPFAEQLADILQHNIPATIAGFGLLAKSVLGQLIPSQEEYKKSLTATQKALEEHLTARRAAAADAVKQFKLLNIEYKTAKGAITELNALNKQSFAGGLVPQGFKDIAAGKVVTQSAKNLQRDLGYILEKYKKASGETFIAVEGQFKGMTVKMARDYQVFIDFLLNGNKQYAASSAATAKLVTSFFQIGLAETRIAAARFTAGVATVFGVLGRTALAALNIAGWVAIITLGWQVVKGIYDWFTATDASKDLEDQAKAWKDLSSNIQDAVKDLKLAQTAFQDISGLGSAAFFKLQAGFAQTVPIDSLNKQIIIYQANVEKAIKLEETLEARANEAKNIKPNFDLYVPITGNIGTDIALQAQAQALDMSKQQAALDEKRATAAKVRLQTDTSLSISEIQALKIQALTASEARSQLDEINKQQDEFAKNLYATLKVVAEANPLFSRYNAILEQHRHDVNALVADYRQFETGLQALSTAEARLQQSQNTQKRLQDEIKGLVAVSKEYEVYSDAVSAAADASAVLAEAQKEQHDNPNTDLSKVISSQKKIADEAEHLKNFLEKNVKEESERTQLLAQQLDYQSKIAGIAGDSLSTDIERARVAKIQTQNSSDQLRIQLALQQVELNRIMQLQVASANDQQAKDANIAFYLFTIRKLNEQIVLQEEFNQLQYNFSKIDAHAKQQERLLNIDKQRNQLATIRAGAIKDEVASAANAINILQRNYVLDQAALDIQIKQTVEKLKQTAAQKTLSEEAAQANQELLNSLGEQLGLLLQQEDVLNKILDLNTEIGKLNYINAYYDKAYNSIDKLLGAVTGFLSLESSTAAAQAQRLAAVLAKEDQIAILKKQEADLADQVTKATGAQKDVAEDYLKTAKLNTAEQENQLAILKKQADEMYQLQQNARAAFSTGLTDAFAAAIKGEETNLETIIHDLAQKVLFSLADSISQMLSNSVTDALGIGPNSELKNAMMQAADYHAALLENVGYDWAKMMAEVIGTTPPAKPTLDSKDRLNAQTIASGMEKTKNELSKIFSSDSTWLQKLGNIFSATAGWITKLLGGLASIFTGGSAQNSWTTAFVNGIEAVVGGATTSKTPTTATPTTTTSTPSTFPTTQTTAMGGIYEGGWKAFATGGIVTKPTYGLVGEGRYNEAVVPLPDGKTIPAMVTGGNTQNNVSVNVDISNNGQAQTSVETDKAKGALLGKALSAAVQAELRRQKRPGGILSPYGS